VTDHIYKDKHISTDVKLLYITVSLPFGSGETFFIPEISELLRRGCDITIVPRSPKGDVTNGDARALEAIALRRPIVSLGAIVGTLLEAARRPRRFLKIIRLLLRDIRPATLSKNLLILPKAVWLGRWARDRKFEHIHAQWASSTATLAMIASEISGIPWSCTAHRGDIAADNLLKEKLHSASFVRFISESGLDMAQRLGANPRMRASPVIHVGVEMPEYADQSTAMTEERRNNPPRLLCPANLLPVKGHKYLLQAASLLKQRRIECELLIAGKGELKRELEAMAADLSLSDTVQFLGQVPHDEILDMYRRRQIDIVVLPSVDLGGNLHEGIPVALVEAMAHGVAVVATETGGIPELLHDGAGIMVPQKDASALADALEKLLRDPALREQIAIAGRSRAKEGWELSTVVDKLLERYRE
jgi:colanic acid/amylovoran biosynthesis glycosyltransferase